MRANYYVHRFFLRPTFSGTANFGASEYGIFSSIFSTLLNVKVNYNYQKAVTSKKNKQNIFSYNDFVDLNVNHVEMERSDLSLKKHMKSCCNIPTVYSHFRKNLIFQT